MKAQIDPEAVNELASGTVDAILTHFAENLPYIVLSDMAGAIIGSLVGAFGRR